MKSVRGSHLGSTQLRAAQERSESHKRCFRKNIGKGITLKF